jgi:hypothetical protein
MPEPEVKTEVVPEVKEEVKKEPDLVTRVSQVKTEVKAKEEIDSKFNINDLDAQIESVQDPAIKEQLVGLKKSLLRGENQKYQEIANLRKQYETKLADVTTWTPDRLKQELSKPDFVQAAQSVLNQNPSNSGLTDDQYSALSDTDKKELAQLKQKISTLEQTNWEAMKIQQDMQLRNKYANYDTTIIDTTATDLVQGKRQATREDLWKVIDYENAVKRAYELGKQDRQLENQEKASGMTFDTGGNMATPGAVERQKGETTQQFMTRSYNEHLKKK